MQMKGNEMNLALPGHALTPTERMTLKLAVQGMANKEIARVRGWSVQRVKNQG